MKMFRELTPEEMHRYYLEVAKRHKAWAKLCEAIRGLDWENWFDERAVYLLMRNEYGVAYTLEVPAKADYLSLLWEVMNYTEEYFDDIEEGREEEFMVDSKNSIGIRDKFVKLIFRLAKVRTAENILRNVEKYGITDKEEAFEIASDLWDKLGYEDRYAEIRDIEIRNTEIEEEAILEAISSRKGE